MHFFVIEFSLGQKQQYSISATHCLTASGQDACISRVTRRPLCLASLTLALFEMPRAFYIPHFAIVQTWHGSCTGLRPSYLAHNGQCTGRLLSAFVGRRQFKSPMRIRPFLRGSKFSRSLEFSIGRDRSSSGPSPKSQKGHVIWLKKAAEYKIRVSQCPLDLSETSCHSRDTKTAVLTSGELRAPGGTCVLTPKEIVTSLMQDLQTPT